MKQTMLKLLFLSTLLLSQLAHALPQGFVYLHERAPGIVEDIRYAGSNNFVGNPIPGYDAGLCILTFQAADQLAKVQEAALKQNYSLKVYDCYRPQRAVDAFYQWSEKTKDTLMKKAFYPRVEKKNLFAQGYIAKSSGHSRGSTVDLTLVKIKGKLTLSSANSTACYGKTLAYLNDNSINTGTRFDCFDPSAHVFYPDLSSEQKANRQLLRRLMLAQGFKPYGKEWWHFTLKNEPYPNTYFDFLVR